MTAFYALLFVTVAILTATLVVLYVKRFGVLVDSKKMFALWLVFVCVLSCISIYMWAEFFGMIAPRLFKGGKHSIHCIIPCVKGFL